jgi:hypothetical protein
MLAARVVFRLVQTQKRDASGSVGVQARSSQQLKPTSFQDNIVAVFI